MLITVDGLAASGKGSLAQALGRHYKLPVLDTGALWRALAWQLMAAGYNADCAPMTLEAAGLTTVAAGLDLDLVGTAQIRTEQVGNLASVLSGFPYLRERIDQAQRDWVVLHQQRGILDGRETGISIAPQADYKFFLFASSLARAGRRAAEMHVVGGELPRVLVEETQRALLTRDRREITRRLCPVRPAKDAVVIDATSRTKRGVLALAIETIEDRRAWADLRQRAEAA